MATRRPLLIVDAANVVGAVPDGWWRDRAGATTRLRDALVTVAANGLDNDRAPEALRRGPIDIVLVVEGAARGVNSIPAVRVVASPRSGDNTIVDVVREYGTACPCFVATTDRGLATRVQRCGAVVIGARTVRPQSRTRPHAVDHRRTSGRRTGRSK